MQVTNFPNPDLGLEQYKLRIIRLKKAESSMLIQVYTQEIGLQAFLFGVNILTAPIPIYL